MAISAARVAAFEILLRVEKTKAFAADLLHSPRYSQLSRADHGLATEIVMGVLRWESLLDARIASRASQPLTKLDGEVRAALRIGAYQLVFLNRIPAHAAINESVELVKRARKRSAAGMTNAVLRNLDKKGTDDLGHPAWLVERWTDAYGPEALKKICDYDQKAPRTTIRVTTADVVRELEAEAIGLEPGSLVAGAYTVINGEITQTRAFREGRVAIQDEGSQLVALLAGSGKMILDCCAAPGGKTRILAEQNPDAHVIAVEVHPHRADLMKRLVRSDRVSVIAADVRKLPLAGSFDRVLVDAPCSGTGTLARNPEIKWRLKTDDLTRLHAYQCDILSAAMKRVGTGGRVTYSTCSLEPEENEQVVKTALERDSSFGLVDCGEELNRLQQRGSVVGGGHAVLTSGPFLRTIPGIHPCDGFFAAVLEKS